MDFLMPKNALLALLPFGITSNLAMKLAIYNDDSGRVYYLKDVPMQDREKANYNATKWCEINTAKLKKLGVVEKKTRKIGVQESGTYDYIALTQKGVYALSNIWTDDFARTKIRDRRLKDNYITELESSHRALEVALKQEEDPDDYTESSAKRAFLESVKREEYQAISDSDLSPSVKIAAYQYSLGPLGYYPQLAAKTRPSQKNSMNNKRIYRRFRDSNIFALFLANGFLTYLDRRHIDTNWKLDEDTNTITLSCEIEAKEELSLTEFLNYTLRHFYRNNPEIYSIQRPSMTQQEWSATPEVYLASELMVYERKLDIDENTIIPNSEKISLHTFNAVGIGRKKNYIIHHARRGNSKNIWYSHVELNSARAVQQSLLAAKRFTNRDDALVEHAVMVVENPSQFVAFLNRLNQNMAEINNDNRKTEKYSLSYPYIGIYAIPMNQSGVVQIRHLMLSTPANVKKRLTELIQRSNPQQLRYRRDSVYTLICKKPAGGNSPQRAKQQECSGGADGGALSPKSAQQGSATQAQRQAEGKMGEAAATAKLQTRYQEVPVYVGHLMNMEEICEVLADYRAGRKILVSCYPGQTAYYRAIMPEIEFL